MIENKGCCSLEWAKKIKELGIVQKSIWYWEELPWKKNEYYADVGLGTKLRLTNFKKAISAWTVAEMGKLLPLDCISERCHTYPQKYICGELYIHKEDIDYCKGCQYGNTEADARAKRLIYLIENGLVKVEDLNKKLEG